VRGGMRESICHPALHHIIDEHFMFIKRTLTYLAVNIIRWMRGKDGGGGGGGGEDRGLGTARVRLN